MRRHGNQFWTTRVALSCLAQCRKKISAEAEGEFERDQHGQISLSREDLDFIREKAAGTGQDPPPAQTEHRFFDTNQP